MIEQQRRHYQSGKDVRPGTSSEEPFAPLELPPPSHLFTTSSIYEPSSVFHEEQKLNPVQPSLTVFSAEEKERLGLVSRSQDFQYYPASRRVPETPEIRASARHVSFSPIPEEALQSPSVRSPQPGPREVGFSPVTLDKFMDSPEEARPREELKTVFSPTSREQPKPPERPRTPPGDHYQQSEARDRPMTVPGLGVSRSLASFEPVRPQTTSVRRRAISLQAVWQQAQVDMSAFLMTPLPKDFVMQCTVRRNRKGFNRIFPSYFLHTSEGHYFVLAGKKRSGNKSSNYLITMNETELKVKSPGYLGKLRSNFVGTEFTIYDTGTNPSKKHAEPETHREELGLIMYHANILGGKGPRKMRVVLPALDQEGHRAMWKPAGVIPKQKSQTLSAKFKQGQFEGMMDYFNKPPIWNERKSYPGVQAFVLNFNGRVDKASVKNFQLIDNVDENHIYLQFGRVGDNLFTLDFQWPFSPLQAFGVALSSLDNKLACE
jgi:hypothetical protein